MKIQEGSHCRYQIRYHLVWKVKYSRRLLFGRRCKYIKQVVEQIAERYDYLIEAVGVDTNHIHVFVGAQPDIAPARIVQTIKSITAREVFKKFPDIKRYLWGGALWAIGYYVRTVSDGPIDKVIKDYIENQGRLHPNQTKSEQLRLVP